MPRCNGPSDDLSESSRSALLCLAERLADGFSGRIVLNCNEGGVSSLTEERTLGRNPDGSRSIEVHTLQASDFRRKAS